MRDIDVLTVGEALVDFVAPDADSLAVARHFVPAAGGAPANVAVGAARLGRRAAFIGAIGDDAFGDFLASLLRSEGLDVSGVIRVPERTSLAFVARNRGGIPDFLFYRGADATLQAADISADLVARAAFVHLSSMALLTSPADTATRYAATLARESGALLSFDPNLRPSNWPNHAGMLQVTAELVSSADVLKVNEEEAYLLTDKRDPADALNLLAEEGKLVVITTGPEGCIWSWQGEAGSIAAPAIKSIDTTGAGDAFVAALLAELSALTDVSNDLSTLTVPVLRTALRFACAAAALACTQAGVMPALPRREHVLSLLAQLRI